MQCSENCFDLKLCVLSRRNVPFSVEFLFNILTMYRVGLFNNYFVHCKFIDYSPFPFSMCLYIKRLQHIDRTSPFTFSLIISFSYFGSIESYLYCFTVFVAGNIQFPSNIIKINTYKWDISNKRHYIYIDLLLSNKYF